MAAGQSQSVLAHVHWPIACPYLNPKKNMVQTLLKLSCGRPLKSATLMVFYDTQFHKKHICKIYLYTFVYSNIKYVKFARCCAHVICIIIHVTRWSILYICELQFALHINGIIAVNGYVICSCAFKACYLCLMLGNHQACKHQHTNADFLLLHVSECRRSHWLQSRTQR